MKCRKYRILRLLGFSTNSDLGGTQVSVPKTDPSTANTSLFKLPTGEPRGQLIRVICGTPDLYESNHYYILQFL